MKSIALLLPLGFALSAFAEDITTTDGKTYTATTVTKVEPDGLRIIHESGTAKIPFEKLPAAIQQKHGYAPAKAAEFKKAAEAALAAQEAAIDKELGTQTAAKAAQQKAEKKRDALLKNATPQTFIIAQVDGSGLLVHHLILDSYSVGGNSNGNGGTPAFRTTRSLGAPAFVTGYPGANELAEGKTISGKFAEAGNHTFVDTDGASRTVVKYQFVSVK